MKASVTIRGVWIQGPKLFAIRIQPEDEYVGIGLSEVRAVAFVETYNRGVTTAGHYAEKVEGKFILPIDDQVPARSQ